MAYCNCEVRPGAVLVSFDDTVWSDVLAAAGVRRGRLVFPLQANVEAFVAGGEDGGDSEGGLGEGPRREIAAACVGVALVCQRPREALEASALATAPLHRAPGTQLRTRRLCPFPSASTAKRALAHLPASDSLLVAACADRDRHTLCVGKAVRDGKLWTLQTRAVACDDGFPPHDTLRRHASDMLRDVTACKVASTVDFTGRYLLWGVPGARRGPSDEPPAAVHLVVQASLPSDPSSGDVGQYRPHEGARCSIVVRAGPGGAMDAQSALHHPLLTCWWVLKAAVGGAWPRWADMCEEVASVGSGAAPESGLAWQRLMTVAREREDPLREDAGAAAAACDDGGHGPSLADVAGSSADGEWADEDSPFPAWDKATDDFLSASTDEARARLALGAGGGVRCATLAEPDFVDALALLLARAPSEAAARRAAARVLRALRARRLVPYVREGANSALALLVRGASEEGNSGTGESGDAAWERRAVRACATALLPSVLAAVVAWAARECEAALSDGAFGLSGNASRAEGSAATDWTGPAHAALADNSILPALDAVRGACTAAHAARLAQATGAAPETVRGLVMRLWQRRAAGDGESADGGSTSVAWQPEGGVTATQAAQLGSPLSAEVVFRVAGAGANDSGVQPRVLTRMTVAPARAGEELHAFARRAGAVGHRRRMRLDGSRGGEEGEDGDEDGEDEDENEEDEDEEEDEDGCTELRLSYQEAKRAATLTTPAVQRAAASHRAEIARALVGRGAGPEGEEGAEGASGRTSWLTLGTLEVETPLPGGLL